MSQDMPGIRRKDAAAFVEGYGHAWERWDVAGFLDLFSDEVVYVAHATQEMVAGRTALASYLQKEAAEQGEVNVRMGSPVIDGDRVAAEFWVTATSGSQKATIVGCLVARLSPDGRCEHFREYWFEVEGHTNPYEGWGE
jgi:ketosteroid isomerase-like protein